MDGRLRQVAPGRWEALLPSPRIQNHAAFLAAGADGLACLWFGGSLEGKSDICIWRSVLGRDGWAAGASRSPTTPPAPSRTRCSSTRRTGGGSTSTPRRRAATRTPASCACASRAARRATCRCRRAPSSAAPILVRDDGAWLLPLFRCIPQAGARWNGSHDTAAVAISADAGETWREVEVPGSVGCVHMTLVPLGGARIAAFYRRRQADFVYRTESADGGETWAVPEPTDVPNNNSSIAAIRLRDGRVAMACNPVNAAMFPDARRQSLYDELGEDDARPDADRAAARRSGACRARR